MGLNEKKYIEEKYGKKEINTDLKSDDEIKREIFNIDKVFEKLLEDNPDKRKELLINPIFTYILEMLMVIDNKNIIDIRDRTINWDTINYIRGKLDFSDIIKKIFKKV